MNTIFSFAFSRLRRRAVAVRSLLIACVCLVGVRPVAEIFAQQFGRVPAQSARYEWRVLNTRVFDVYYHEGGEYLGQFAAFTLEESVKSLQRILALSLSDRIDAVVYASANGARQSNARDILLPKGILNVHEARRNKIVVSFSGDYAELKRQLVRELVRYILNTVFYGNVLPPALGGQFELPVWFSEGLAEYFASGGLSAETDMALRDILSNNAFTGFASLSERGNAALAAPIGSAFFWYVAEKFGVGRIGEFLSRMRGLRSVDNAFRSTFGMNAEGFAAAWKRELKNEFAPPSGAFDDIQQAAARVISEQNDGSRLVASPAWAPVADKSGDKLAYLSEQGGVWNLMILFDGRFKRTQNVLNTGKAVDKSRLYLRESMAQRLAWRPDGSQIACVVADGAGESVVIVNPQNGALTRFDLGLDNVYGVAWSPDGKTIALAASRNGNPDLFTLDVASKKLARLTNDLFSESSPAWSPDGRTLYFISNRGGNLSAQSSSATVDLWAYPIDNTDVYALSLQPRRGGDNQVAIERVTQTPEQRKIALSVQSDGKRLFILSDGSGVYNCYELTLATGNLEARTNLKSGAREFGFSRDGSKLALSALTGGAFEIVSLAYSPKDKPKNPEPTPLRKQSLERESAAAKALDRAGTASAKNIKGDDNGDEANAGEEIIILQAPDSLRGYGKYDVSFAGQKMVAPNPDALAQNARLNAAEASDFGAAMGRFTPELPQFSLRLESWEISPYFDTFFAGRFSQGQSALFSNFGLAAQALWADPLGDHRIFASIMGMLNFSNNDQFVSYSYLPEALDYEIQLFRTARENLVIDQREAIPGLLSYFGGAAKVTLPLGDGLRVEGKASFVNALRESLVAAGARVNRSDFFIAPEIRLVLDNTETGFFGPVSGARGFAQIDGAPFGLADLSFVRAIADYRQYIPLGGSATFAARVGMGVNLGETPQNFLVGGQESMIVGRSVAPDILPFNRGEDLFFLQAAMPMRAFALAERVGANFFAANLETRFSLLSPDNSNSFLSSIFNGLQCVVFTDIGSAWTEQLRFNPPRALFDAFDQYVGLAEGDLLISLGAGVRTFLLGQHPVKIDVAWQFLQDGLMLPRLVIGFGYNF